VSNYPYLLYYHTYAKKSISVTIDLVMPKTIEPTHDIAPAGIYVPHPTTGQAIIINPVVKEVDVPSYIDKKALAYTEQLDNIRHEQRWHRAKLVVQFAGFEALALGIGIILTCLYGLSIMPAAWYFAVVLFVGVLLIYESLMIFRYRYHAYLVIRASFLIAAGSGFFSLLPSGINSSLTGIIIGVVIMICTAPAFFALQSEDVKALF